MNGIRQRKRRKVFRRCRNRCWYCGGIPTTIDHAIPRSRNGHSRNTNLVACCARCNKLKADRTVEEFRAWLRKFYLPGHRKQTGDLLMMQIIKANQFYGEECVTPAPIPVNHHKPVGYTLAEKYREVPWNTE